MIQQPIRSLDTIPALLSHHASQFSQSPALINSAGGVLSYQELQRQVHQIGKTLMMMGIQPTDRVAVVVPNGTEMAIGVLATSSAAACAPLNPAFVPAEFEFYLNDLKPAAILMLQDDDCAARDVARAAGITVVEMISDGKGGIDSLVCSDPKARQAPQPADCHRDDPALLLHTSGTTSRPKLVPLTHCNLLTSAKNVAHTLSLSPDDRCLNLMPLFHIHGLVGALLSSVAAGASVICTSGFTPDGFVHCMKALEPSWYTAVPTLHQAILAAVGDGGALREGGHRLRLIRSSSSALPPTVLSALEKAFGCPVIESYGMTEAAHQMASNPLPPGRRKAGSVGLPAGPEIRISGEEGVTAAAGVVGEIVIRGPNVITGYADNPDANQRSFVEGWFRTGDQGYFDGDGYLHISGRLKELINRGGEKVSPREIDEVLMDHPDIAQAVAFAISHPSLGEDIAAAVVPRKGATIDEPAIRRFATTKLPPFKVPSRIVVLPDIPKGPTGKIQRVGLAERLKERLATVYSEPQGFLERQIAAIYSELLNVPQVGREGNFFYLGGDSLLATRAASRIRESLHVDLALTALFESPTVAALAEEVARLPTSELDERELSDLLAEIEQLSDEEARQLLTTAEHASTNKQRG